MYATVHCIYFITLFQQNMQEYAVQSSKKVKLLTLEVEDFAGFKTMGEEPRLG